MAKRFFFLLFLLSPGPLFLRKSLFSYTFFVCFLFFPLPAPLSFCVWEKRSRKYVKWPVGFWYWPRSRRWLKGVAWYNAPNVFMGVWRNCVLISLCFRFPFIFNFFFWDRPERDYYEELDVHPYGYIISLNNEWFWAAMAWAGAFPCSFDFILYCWWSVYKYAYTNFHLFRYI